MTEEATKPGGPLNELAARIHANAVAKGFYDEGKTAGFDGMLMNIVSEVEEAHRFWRKGRDLSQVWREIHAEAGQIQFERLSVTPDGRYNIWWTPRQLHPAVFTQDEWMKVVENMGITPEPNGIPVELIDVIIRALDTLAMIGVDIDGIMAEKMAYNATRPYRHGDLKS